MKALCENDLARGRGYARFCCAEVTDLNAQYSFSLCRASDQTFLARSGWQNAEEQHSPEGLSVEGDRLILNVGPSIVDNLDENENYRLTLHAPGLPPQRAAFSIAQINRSLRDAAGSLQMPTAAAVAPQPEPQPAPEPHPLPEEPIAAPEPQQQKSVLPLVLAVVLVLALAGGGLWWYLQKDKAAGQTTEQAATTEQITEQAAPADKKDEAKPEPEKVQPEPEKAPEKAEPAPAPAPEPKPEPEKTEAKPAEAQPATQATPAPVLAPRERVRQYLGGSPTAPGAMQMADELLAGPDGSKPDTQDSVYRLHYYAKQQGDAAAMLSLARSADPTQPAWGSLPKNAAEAWALYAAAAPQKPEAAQAMQGLKQWLETEAAKDNKQALGWIEEIGRGAK